MDEARFFPPEEDESVKENVPLYPWKTINKFSEIDIKPNTIVLCDIDDTVLHHPFLNSSWTSIITTFFMTKRFTERRFCDHFVAENDTDEYVQKIIKERPIAHTDRDGFFNMADLARTLVFITARMPQTEQFTKENLLSIDIDPLVYKVWFSGFRPKGEFIASELDLTGYDHVVFIDDQVRNLENVHSKLIHPHVELYKFEHVKPDPFTYYPFPDGFNSKLRYNGVQLSENPFP
jgi:hypothetical protein